MVPCSRTDDPTHPGWLSREWTFPPGPTRRTPSRTKQEGRAAGRCSGPPTTGRTRSQSRGPPQPTCPLTRQPRLACADGAWVLCGRARAPRAPRCRLRPPHRPQLAAARTVARASAPSVPSLPGPATVRLGPLLCRGGPYRDSWKHQNTFFGPFFPPPRTATTSRAAMNFDLGLGAGLDQPSFFEVSAHERVVPTLYNAFEHAITVRQRAGRGVHRHAQGQQSALLCAATGSRATMPAAPLRPGRPPHAHPLLPRAKSARPRTLPHILGQVLAHASASRASTLHQSVLVFVR